MSNVYQMPTQLPSTVGVAPNQRFAIFGDSLSEVTTPGYLNKAGLDGAALSSTDIIQAFYDFDLQSQNGVYGVFTISFSGTGEITLTSWANPGEVVLPVIDGNFANFVGTSGQIKDSGFSASDASKTSVVMASAATTVNTFAAFTDTSGTIQSTVRADGTVVSNAVTCNGQVGKITTESLSGAAPSPYFFTWTNSYITANSVVQFTMAGGTTINSDVCFKAVVGAGTCSVTVVNTTSAFGGTVIIGYTVL